MTTLEFTRPTARTFFLPGKKATALRASLKAAGYEVDYNRGASTFTAVMDDELLLMAMRKTPTNMWIIRAVEGLLGADEES